MTLLIHEPMTTREAVRTGVVFVPCAICHSPVDLGIITEANDAPICGKHFVADYPPLD